VAIAAGWYHNLALTSSGLVTAWGAGTNVDYDYSADKGQSIVPAGLSNVCSMAGGYTFSLALVGSGPPVTKALLTAAAQDTSGFRVSIPTQSGRVYALEYKDSMSQSNWNRLPLVAGNGKLLTLRDPTATNTQRFFRVRDW
jgi:hypothetical protein